MRVERREEIRDGREEKWKNELESEVDPVGKGKGKKRKGKKIPFGIPPWIIEKPTDPAGRDLIALRAFSTRTHAEEKKRGREKQTERTNGFDRENYGNVLSAIIINERICLYFVFSLLCSHPFSTNVTRIGFLVIFSLLPYAAAKIACQKCYRCDYQEFLNLSFVCYIATDK